MLIKETCPDCGHACKKNGHIHNGKQRYKCLSCPRQFVPEATKKYINQATYTLINKALLERLSLRAICRLADVSLTWLCNYTKRLYATLPDDLNAKQFISESEQATEQDDIMDKVARSLAPKESLNGLSVSDMMEIDSSLSILETDNDVFTDDNTYPFDVDLVLSKADEVLLAHKDAALLSVIRLEADELCSFVQNKNNKQWLWLVMNTATRQIISFHVGSRGKADAQQLLDKTPDFFKQHGTFFTDFWKAYELIESEQHVQAGKETGLCNHIERFNNTLRQMCARLVRKTLSFSKKLEQHIGAIKYFLCHYNRLLALRI